MPPIASAPALGLTGEPDGPAKRRLSDGHGLRFEWQPPVPVVPLVVVFAVVALALGVAVLRQWDSPVRRVLRPSPYPAPAESATGASTA